MSDKKNQLKHHNPSTNVDQSNKQLIEEKDLKKIIEAIRYDITDYELIKTVESIAHSLVKANLTTSQVRKFYGEMMRIQMVGLEKERSSLLLLVPKLYYNMKRNDKYEGLRGLKELVETMVKEVDSSSNPSEQKEKFKRMLQITEAFVAFHKVYDAIYSNKKNKNQQ